MEEINIRLKYLTSIALIILILNLLSINVYATQIKSEEVVKVGIYKSEPYYSIDDAGNVSGYYHDLLNLLQEKYKFQYEYVLGDFEDGMKDLESGKIDIILGISITTERIDKLAFSKKYIAREEFGLLTNKDITFNDLENIDGLKIGLVKGAASVEMTLDFFSANNIHAEPVYGADWDEVEKLLEEGKVDIILHNNYEELGLKSLYTIQGDQVYIAANKNRVHILNKLDGAIEEYQVEKPNKIDELYNEYFNEDYYKVLLKDKILIIISIILIIFISKIFLIPKIRKNRIKNKIKVRLRENKYLLQYQPIYNPRNNNIVGFEGLLRLLDEDNKIIPPEKFIPEIEENHMLFHISLWILKEVIKDYDKIKNCKTMEGKDFYISLNLSLNEIENDSFVKRAIDILQESNLGANQICLEIIERVKMNDLDKIKENINLLKEAGFKIAIDDFGVEYSNLDVLQKLDIDTIKIDKNFVDGIGKDMIKNEIILFISKIARAANKSVVLEGIEEVNQHRAIKNIENPLLYVQGYYYNKPMYIEDIEKL